MIEDLFTNNRAWSSERKAEAGDYFERLSKLQEPEYLWIGCSDSRVPANVIKGLEPGEVFVHRNVANLNHPTNLDMLSRSRRNTPESSMRLILGFLHTRSTSPHTAFGSLQTRLPTPT